jgi:hypothetical protein
MAIALEYSHQHRHNNSSTRRESVVNCMAGLVGRISCWQRSLGCALSWIEGEPCTAAYFLLCGERSKSFTESVVRDTSFTISGA